MFWSSLCRWLLAAESYLLLVSLPPLPFSRYCTEWSMWRRIVIVQSFVCVCVSVSEGQNNAVLDIGITGGCWHPDPHCLYTCAFGFCSCMLQCWKRESQPSPCCDYVAAQELSCISGSVELDQAYTERGWRAGAAGSPGPSAPSATQLVWVNSTGVSIAAAKATAQELEAVKWLHLSNVGFLPGNVFILKLQELSVHPAPLESMDLSTMDAHVSAVSFNNAVPHAAKRAACYLSCTLHFMLFPLLSPILLSLMLISSLSFVPAPSYICVWMSWSLPALQYVFCVHV